jgi:DNA ligase-1
VLDGEVLIWRGDGPSGRPLAFADLQKRLNRKVAPTAQASLFDLDRAVFLAFDVLELGGVDRRQEPFAARRALLDVLVRSTPGADRLILSRRVEGKDWGVLARERERARDLGAEGLMLKHVASPYGSGRLKVSMGDARAAGWLKWKAAPYGVDAVLVYAQPGSGRRAGLYTDYTFGVWSQDPETGARVLTPFAKAYSGLTNEEIHQVDAFVRRHSTDRYGPVRNVEPKLVFEIAFEDIRESDRHKSGVAVRFPRIARWRTDKKPEEADTLDTLRRMLAAKKQAN